MLWLLGQPQKGRLRKSTTHEDKWTAWWVQHHDQSSGLQNTFWSPGRVRAGCLKIDWGMHVSSQNKYPCLFCKNVSFIALKPAQNSWAPLWMQVTSQKKNTAKSPDPCPAWGSCFYQLTCPDWKWFTYCRDPKLASPCEMGRSVVGYVLGVEWVQVCVLVSCCPLLHTFLTAHLQPPPRPSHNKLIMCWSWRNDFPPASETFRVTKLCSEPPMKVLAGFNCLAVVRSTASALAPVSVQVSSTSSPSPQQGEETSAWR